MWWRRKKQESETKDPEQVRLVKKIVVPEILRYNFLQALTTNGFCLLIILSLISQRGGGYGAGILFSTMTAIIVAKSYLYFRGKLSQKAQDVLGGLDDVRCLVTLPVLFPEKGKIISIPVENVQIRILNGLQAHDLTEMELVTRRLVHSLVLCRSEEVSKAALYACERMGDRDAIPVVERLLKTKKDIFATVAERCLEHLKKQPLLPLPEKTRDMQEVEILLAKIVRQKEKIRFLCNQIGCMLFLYVIPAGFEEGYIDLSWIFIVGGYVFLVLAVVYTIKQVGNLNQLGVSLADSLDIHHIGILLDRIGTMSQSYIRPVLLRMLPRLQHSDMDRLTPAQREKLYKLPQFFRNPLLVQIEDSEVILAVLKALQQIGDADAIPHVQRLIQKTRNKEILRAANETLPFLLERQQQTTLSQTLLRAADAHSSAPETLLRPAQSHTATRNDELLHPVGETPIVLTTPVAPEVQTLGQGRRDR